MFKKLTIAAGFGAGYVLGAKAGQERYAQIEAKFREFAGMPAVQNATSAVKETASGVADSAKQTLGEKTGKNDPDVVVEFGAAGSAPMAGATASDSAPDITRL